MSESTHEPSRPIDWFGIAPWLLLLRVPKVAMGWPYVAGAIGALLLGGVADNPCPLCATCDGGPCPYWTPTDGLGHALLQALWCLAWLPLGWWITGRAAAALTGIDRREPFSGKQLLGDLGNLLGALGLLLGMVALLALPLLACGALVQVEWLSGLVPFVWPLVLLAAGLPLTVLLVGGVLGSPFLLPAIVVDRADLFDALSRMYAYAYQRLARYVFYLVVGLLALLAGAVLVELLLTGTLLVALNCLQATGLAAEERGLLEGTTWIVVRLVRGYYPAALFTLGTALYLLLRQDVDQQPTDEMAS